jgi:hypothetical protein
LFGSRVPSFRHVQQQSGCGYKESQGMKGEAVHVVEIEAKQKSKED